MRSRSACIALAIALGSAAPAFGQSKPGAESRWTIEFYGGTASNSASSGGAIPSGVPVPVGATFTTDSGTPSRLQSTWFAGDGSILLNQVMAQFATLEGVTLSRIVPLDAAIASSITQRKGGAAFGIRLSRILSPRLALEFSAERSSGGQAFTDKAAAAFETSRASFADTFEDLLNLSPSTNISVVSTMTVRGASASHTRLSGALRYSLMTTSKASVYVVAGGGIAMNPKDDLQAIFNGNYAFRVYSAYPMSETDRAIVGVSSKDTEAFGLAGGGVTYDISSRVGLRADVRVALSPRSDETTILGSPTVATVAPAFVLASSSQVTPGIQFSSTTGIPSSLSATGTARTTFIGSGMNRRVAFTVGIFRRF